MPRTRIAKVFPLLAALVAAGPVGAADRQTDERLQAIEARLQRIDQVLGNQALIDMQQQLTVRR